MSVEKLYTRKATGLVREISIFTAVIIAICNAVGLGWQKRVFQATGWTPIGESQYFLGIHPVVMAFAIAGIVILISLYCFAMLSAAMPRSGGGYIFISRIIGPFWGVVATWFQVFAVAVSYGLIAVAVMEAVMIFGSLAGITQLGLWATPQGLFIFGTLIVILFSGIACFGVKMTGYLLQVLFWVPAVILVAVYAIFLVASPAVMDAGVKALWGHTATEYTQAAIAQGMDKIAAGNTYWGAVFSAMVAAYWAYIGYASASFVAGEVKEAHKALPRAMFTSGLVIIFLYMTISTLMARAAMMVGKVGDFSLMSAMGFLNYGGGSFAKAGLPQIGGWMPMVAAMQAAGMGMTWLLPLLVLFAAFWVANDIPPFILSTSRMIFAMAFDRLLPPALANVNEKWHSPVNAIIFTSVVSIVLGCTAESGVIGAIWPGSFLATFTSGFAVGVTDLWDILFFGIVAFAAVLFPIRKPEIFERSPFRLSKNLTITLGVLAVLGNAFAFFVVAKAGGFWTDPLQLGLSGLVLVLGIVLYWYYSNAARRTGVELKTLFTEIPPD
jgi:APA family basic amino acid/polyamine antiporter